MAKAPGERYNTKDRTKEEGESFTADHFLMAGNSE
jgi:hypothetical protein